MYKNNSAWLLSSRVFAAFIVVSISACGGGGDSAKSASSASLSGGWYSSKTLAAWSFFEDNPSSGSGQLFQGSIDGTACRTTLMKYSLNPGASTVSYTITRAIGSGPNNVYDSGTVSQGPFTEKYTVQGNSATIGSATYSSVNYSFRPKGCEGQ
jgi:hypothetical protein